MQVVSVPTRLLPQKGFSDFPIRPTAVVLSNESGPAHRTVFAILFSREYYPRHNMTQRSWAN